MGRNVCATLGELIYFRARTGIALGEICLSDQRERMLLSQYSEVTMVLSLTLNISGLWTVHEYVQVEASVS